MKKNILRKIFSVSFILVIVISVFSSVQAMNNTEVEKAGPNTTGEMVVSQNTIDGWAAAPGKANGGGETITSIKFIISKAGEEIKTISTNVEPELLPGDDSEDIPNSAKKYYPFSVDLSEQWPEGFVNGQSYEVCAKAYRTVGSGEQFYFSFGCPTYYTASTDISIDNPFDEIYVGEQKTVMVSSVNFDNRDNQEENDSDRDMDEDKSDGNGHDKSIGEGHDKAIGNGHNKDNEDNEGDQGNETNSLEWSSTPESKLEIVNVTENAAVFEGAEAGHAIIEARQGESNDTFPVKVLPVLPETIAIDVNETYNVFLRGVPQGESVSWEIISGYEFIEYDSSHHSDILPITGKSPGMIQLRAYIEDETGEKFYSNVSTVTVGNPAAHLSATDLTHTISVGETLDLSKYLVVNPSDADLFWKSKDNSVVVNNDGVITGMTPTDQYVEVAVYSGEHEVTFHIMVIQLITNMYFKEPSYAFEMDQFPLSLEGELIFDPIGVTNKVVHWRSSSEDIATVDPLTGSITAHSNGTTTITAVSTDGSGKEASTELTVGPVLIDTITISDEEINLMVGESISLDSLELDIQPEDAANIDLVWSIANDNIAGISTETGEQRLVGTSPGTTTLTVTAVDGGGASATITVNVLQPEIELNGLKFEQSTYTINVGQQLDLLQRLNYIPENATNKNVLWSTSDINSKYVSLNVMNGIVTGMSQGYAIITATSEDGQKTSKVLINVIANSGGSGGNNSGGETQKPIDNDQDQNSW